MQLRILPWFALALSAFAAEPVSPNEISGDSARGAQKLIGLDFPAAKIEMALPGLEQHLKHYRELRNVPLPNSVPPCLWFNPVPAAASSEWEREKIRLGPRPKVRKPADPSALAYYSVRELGVLIKSRQVTSAQLTHLYLDRLRAYGPRLSCVVTLTADLALSQARRADTELAAGRYRGPLHGIPYGAKDLFAVRGVATTWGAAPYTNQFFVTDATVIKRLEEAGAVLVAKTSLGELAMGDVWFGGTTRNPWNTQQGSSGSSAGSAAGVAAGLFAFALGSETYGSIVSPCDRCGVTGLRPTFGRVSRAGAMALSWSMDKIGPICRTAEDCAIILDAIYGPDGLDQSVQNMPFKYDSRARLKTLRVGYLKSDFENQTGERKLIDEATLSCLRGLGADLIPVQFPSCPLGAVSLVLSTEAATAFDELTRTGQDDWLKQQERGSWPNTFREHRFVTAVEYLQAQRVRYLLVQDTARVFADLDLIVAPAWSGRSLLLSNLTGHPCVVLPNGFSTNGTPTTVCFIGRLFGEGRLLAAAKEYQEATDFHRRHPALD